MFHRFLGQVDQPNQTTYRFRQRILDYLIEKGDLTVGVDGDLTLSPGLRRRARDTEAILSRTVSDPTRRLMTA